MSYPGRSRSGYGSNRRSSQHSKKGKRKSKKKKWFKAEGSLYGWHKNGSDISRHRAINKAIERKGLLKTFNSLLGLANITQDEATRRKAKADYKWMSEEYADGLARARKQLR